VGHASEEGKLLESHRAGSSSVQAPKRSGGSPVPMETSNCLVSASNRSQAACGFIAREKSVKWA
jgi:hypothetical protein